MGLSGEGAKRSSQYSATSGPISRSSSGDGRNLNPPSTALYRSQCGARIPRIEGLTYLVAMRPVPSFNHWACHSDQKGGVNMDFLECTANRKHTVYL